MPGLSLPAAFPGEERRGMFPAKVTRKVTPPGLGIAPELRLLHHKQLLACSPRAEEDFWDGERGPGKGVERGRSSSCPWGGITWRGAAPYPRAVILSGHLGLPIKDEFCVPLTCKSKSSLGLKPGARKTQLGFSVLFGN